MGKSTLLGLLLLGCATAARPEPANPENRPQGRALAAEACADEARSLEASGAHLEASFYFEAALAAGADERAILPELIAAEVRAGRLREAGRNLSRLREMEGDGPGARELALLLDRLAPSGAPEPAR